MSNSTKIAIVTGAGSGVGKAAARALLTDGWKLALAGRRPDPLEQVIADAGVGSDQAIAIPTDVSDEAAVKALFDKTANAFGRIDMLFNNAGISAPPLPLEELTIDQWRQVVDINLTGMFICTKFAFLAMKTQSPKGGRIINNGSISASAPRPDSAPYTSTKHAVLGLTKSSSLDGRKHNIAVGQIDIGNAATEMAQRMADGVPQANGEIVAEPLMDVDHVGAAVRDMANLPLESNIQYMTIMATKMPFVGRG